MISERKDRREMVRKGTWWSLERTKNLNYQRQMSSILRICGKRREYVALRPKENKNLVYVVYVLEDLGGVCISCTFN